MYMTPLKKKIGNIYCISRLQGINALGETALLISQTFAAAAIFCMLEKYFPHSLIVLKIQMNQPGFSNRLFNQ